MIIDSEVLAKVIKSMVFSNYPGDRQAAIAVIAKYVQETQATDGDLSD